MEEILDFLDKAEAAGQNVVTVIGPQVDLSLNDPATDGENTTQNVSWEARQLKSLFLKLYECN
jgi:DNA-binding ferritin-like protein (Dps family)